MSATIFTGWHLLTYGTATNIIFVGAAVLVLRSKVRESRDYMAAGDAAFAQAEQRDAAFEETRNKPWYWPTGPAIEAVPADDHMTGELLAVDGVDTEADAPAEDTDRKDLWRVLLGLASDLVDRVHDWLPNLLRERRERDQVGDGRALAEVLAASGYELDEETDEEFEAAVNRAEAEPEPVRIVRVNRYRDPGMTGQFPLVKVVGDKAAGRHRLRPEPEMPAVNPVPKQRDGGDRDA